MIGKLAIDKNSVDISQEMDYINISKLIKKKKIISDHFLFQVHLISSITPFLSLMEFEH